MCVCMHAALIEFSETSRCAAPRTSRADQFVRHAEARRAVRPRAVVIKCLVLRGRVRVQGVARVGYPCERRIESDWSFGFGKGFFFLVVFCVSARVC